MSHQPDDALEVLRGVWDAQGQTSADLEDCGTSKSCRSMANINFDGLAGPDGDLRTAKHTIETSRARRSRTSRGKRSRRARGSHRG